MGRVGAAGDEAQCLRPSKRPKDWGAELPEDPILSSQASSPPLVEEQGTESPTDLRGKLENRRRPSKRGQPKLTLQKKKTYNILVALGVAKHKGPPEKPPPAEQQQEVPRLLTNGHVAKNGPRSQKQAGQRSCKEPDDLRHIAQAKAPADVEATVETVGKLEVQELPLQPGEFVSTRMLKVRRANAKEANCWRLWATQAECNGTELMGQRVLIRSTRVHEIDGRIEFTGCEAVETTS